MPPVTVMRYCRICKEKTPWRRYDTCAFALVCIRHPPPVEDGLEKYAEEGQYIWRFSDKQRAEAVEVQRAWEARYRDDPWRMD